MKNALTFLCLISLGIILTSTNVHAQNNLTFFQKSDTLNKQRRNAVVITGITGSSLALLGLNQLWYADYEKSGFHFHNDNDQWLQMDKVGHAFSAYTLGKISMDALDWAGVSRRDRLLYGATFGFVFLTAVEVMDGFSEEWGFSLGDLAANALGTGLLIGQELLWQEQRILFKFSFQSSSYAQYYPDKLGKSKLEQIFKDYNGQTYWLSFNIWSFFKNSNIPKWLNISIGYGAEGLPPQIIENPIYPPVHYDTYRQFYTSIDVDLTKIRTNSAFLKTVFNVFNYIKIPAPTLEYNEKEQFKFHWIYF